MRTPFLGRYKGICATDAVIDIEVGGFHDILARETVLFSVNELLQSISWWPRLVDLIRRKKLRVNNTLLC